MTSSGRRFQALGYTQWHSCFNNSHCIWSEARACRLTLVPTTNTKTVHHILYVRTINECHNRIDNLLRCLVLPAQWSVSNGFGRNMLIDPVDLFVRQTLMTSWIEWNDAIIRWRGKQLRPTWHVFVFKWIGFILWFPISVRLKNICGIRTEQLSERETILLYACTDGRRLWLEK